MSLKMERRHTVFGTPIKRIGIDEVRRRECRKPSTRKGHCGCDAESVRAQALRWDFATGQPGVGGDHTVVATDVDDRQADDGLQSISTHHNQLAEKDRFLTFPVLTVPGLT
jgi:hypothetical protein